MKQQTLLETKNLTITKSERGCVTYTFENSAAAMGDLFQQVQQQQARIAELTGTLTVIANNPGWLDHHCRAQAVLKSTTQESGR